MNFLAKTEEELASPPREQYEFILFSLAYFANQSHRTPFVAKLQEVDDDILFDDDTIHIAAPFMSPGPAFRTESRIQPMSLPQATEPIHVEDRIVEFPKSVEPVSEEREEISEEEKEALEEDHDNHDAEAELQDLLNAAADEDVTMKDAEHLEDSPEQGAPVETEEPAQGPQATESQDKPKPSHTLLSLKPTLSGIPKPAIASSATTSATSTTSGLSIEERLLRAQQNRERLEAKRLQALQEKKSKLEEAERRREEKLEQIRLKVCYV